MHQEILKNIENIENYGNNYDRFDEDFDQLSQYVKQINRGVERIAYQENNQWITNQIAKRAIILYLRFSGFYFSKDNYRYKINNKFSTWSDRDFEKSKIRVCPPSHIKYTSYIGNNCVLMPCFVNVGAYIGEGTMIDTWATVGSCAQIGKNVHISGGAGIGGVLEPANANPTIIEDDCFIGARSEIVEGVIIKKGAVISMGVFIGASTKIIDRSTGEIIKGYVPENAVVIPGSVAIENTNLSQACAIIVKYADAKTRGKVQINELLRGL